MKVLVTGGAGYIGSVLLRVLLEKGYDVVCLDRFFFGLEPVRDIADRVSLVKGDIRWFDASIIKGIDAVIDLAALSNDPSGELDPKKTMDINYRGRVRVASLAKKYGVRRYILASSCSVYGAGEKVIDECSEINPLTTYAKANYLAERDILPLTDKSFCVTILRQATVYGLSYRMRFDLAINGMVRSLFKEGMVRVMRDGSQWRPFVHVKDACRAFLTALEAEEELVRGETFNVGSNEQNYQILGLAKLVAEAVNLPFKYEWYGSPDLRNYRVNFDKIRKRLGFKPEYTPAHGAREIYEALSRGEVDPDDPRTIRVQWYKHLLYMQKFLRDIEINGVLL